MNLRFHRLALEELHHEVEYYESKQTGLGDELDGHLQAAFAFIRRFPRAAPQWRDRPDRRVKVVDGFPLTPRLLGAANARMTPKPPGSRPMTTPRSSAMVVRKVRLAELDEQAERRAYWQRQTPADRLAEVESLRRLWIEVTGDPDVPMVRVVHRRPLGEPAIQRPG